MLAVKKKAIHLVLIVCLLSNILNILIIMWSIIHQYALIDSSSDDGHEDNINMRRQLKESSDIFSISNKMLVN